VLLVGVTELGTVLLILGIVYHVLFMLGLRRARQAMKSKGVLYAESQFPPSLVLIVAVLLLLIGLAAAGSMVLHVKPYE
jgi:inner membrane protein YidH